MNIVTVAQLKKQVHLESDFTLDDDYLEHLIDTSEEVVFNYLGRSQDDFKGEDDKYNFPASIKHAVLLVAAHFYNQREAVSNIQMYNVPVTLLALCNPYRILTSTTE